MNSNVRQSRRGGGGPVPVRLGKSPSFRIGHLQRRLVLDASGAVGAVAELMVDTDWESSGMVDVNLDRAGDLTILDTVAAGSNNHVTLTLGKSAQDLVVSQYDPSTSTERVVFQSNGQTLSGKVFVNLGQGNDVLTVDLRDSIAPTNEVRYDGGTGGNDGLFVIGGGNQATYRPDASVSGAGLIDVDGLHLIFSNLEPVDMTGMSEVLVSFDGGNESLTVSPGNDFFSGGNQTAWLVSGSSGGVPIETIALWNNDLVTIDTTTVDGNDLIWIDGLSPAAGNQSLNVITGVGADRTVINGPATLDGSLSLQSTSIELNTNSIVTRGEQVYDGAVSIQADLELSAVDTDSDALGIDFLGSVQGNGHDLTGNGGVVFNEPASGLGNVTLDRLRTHSTLGAEQLLVSGSSELGGDVTTDGHQQYGGKVTLTDDVTLIAGDLNASGDQILFNSTVDDDGADSTPSNLTLQVAGGLRFQEQVGGAFALDSVTITNATNVEFEQSVRTRGDFTQLAGSGTTTLRGTSGTGIGGATRISTDTLVFEDASWTSQEQIDLLAENSVVLGPGAGLIAATSTVSITSLNGSISDGDASDNEVVDITAQSAILSAADGIGDDNPLETRVDLLSAEVTDAGSIRISEFDGIELNSLSTQDGLVDVVAGGSIVATDIESKNSSNLDSGFLTSDSRDISLSALGAGSSVMVGRIVAQNGADVRIDAGNDIVDTNVNDSQRIVADDLVMHAGNQSQDSVNGILVSTAVNDLDASVAGQQRGDLVVWEADSINLASSDALSDQSVLQTSNGEIRIHAGESITITDLDPSNEGDQRTADPEVIAGGENGRVSLVADDDMTIDNGVQIHATDTADASVVLSAGDQLTLGKEIEINTGNSTGVARVFLPRPELGLTTQGNGDPNAPPIESAFFDYDTIETTILASEVGGFGGDLSLLVGTSGERGLSISVDWGVETNRFEKFEGINADDGIQTIHHQYNEVDILLSQLNGRASSTDPIEVRFAVAQHDSIVVQAGAISQGDYGPVDVPGRLASTTDNIDTTPLLENGQAQFIVPNLSIPTRLFFPAPEYPVVERRLSEPYVHNSTMLTTVRVVAETTVVTTSTVRDEYFQIQMISPDPLNQWEVAAQRLPDDILSGDKLQQLFSQLPDGTYEVQYVLGEGNERSILRVEIRQGKPILSGEALDGGLLKLKEIDQGTFDE